QGDVVVGVIPARPEMALACAAVPAVATLAPLSPSLTPNTYAELLTRLRPKLVILPDGVDHPLRAAARRCGVAEADLVPNFGAPAGMFALELGHERESLTREASSRPDWAYLLTTSGTTGRPKIVPWSHRSLELFAQQLGNCLQIAQHDTGCHLVPMHHSHGLVVALMIPLLRGSSVVCLPESDIDGFFAALEQHRLTWLTAVPAVHREILRRVPDFPEVVADNCLRVMKVSAGRLEPEEIDRIERVFDVPLLVGYGMTEARMIAHEPLPPRVRKRGSVGVPVCNEVAVMSETGALCATGDVGEVVVRGPLVFDGYFDEPEDTAAMFVEGWFRTGDLGRFDEDGYLYLVGRIKEIINRGGEKIAPAEIDAAIAPIQGIREVATFAIPHQSLGEEIAAAVVVDSTVAILASDIIEQVRQRLGPKRVPRHIYFVDRLPRTDSGKIRRSELTRRFGLGEARAPSTGETSVSAIQRSESPLEAALMGLWSSVLEVSPVGIDDDFFVLGGDRLRAAQLLTTVKSLFGIDLPVELMFRSAGTVAGMAHAIEQASSVNATVDRR
ncbi:MAG: non-ribosomal peptide synthetase, partial [Burkholderiales bacterium]